MLQRSEVLKKVFIASVFLLSLYGCGGGGGSREGYPTPFHSVVARVYPANQDGVYSKVLRGCVYTGQQTESCSLSILPLIGQEHDDPDIDDVMNRVVVSHKWMGERFRAMLEILPPDILQLSKSVTAFVIASDIRPSRYSSWTGAIYIDPEYLWLTEEEKSDVDPTPDYRTDFGKDLQYVTPWRYVKDNQYAYFLSGEERKIEDIKYRFAQVFYHELGHAIDFFPPQEVEDLPLSQSVRDAAQSIQGERISDLMKENFSLGSDTLKLLALVMFGGWIPSEFQKGLAPADVADELKVDLANDDYNYYTQYEDLAMIFEELMMYCNFGIERDFAVTSKPVNENPHLNDYVVAWGQRNRISASNIREKVEFIVSLMLPDSDFSACLQNMSGPIEMTPGLGWWDNLEIGSTLEIKRKYELEKKIDLTIEFNLPYE